MKQDQRQLDAFKAAKTHLGLKEIKGKKHEAAIVGFFEAVGHGWVKDDETAWCAAFLGAVLKDNGLPLPPLQERLAARSYLMVGEPVELKDAKPGDLVVFWRGAPTGWQGHAGFLVSHDKTTVAVLGGNQSDAVSIAPYPVSRLLGVRRFPAPKSQENWVMKYKSTIGFFAFVVIAAVIFLLARGSL